MTSSVDEVLGSYWDEVAPLRNPVLLVALHGLFDIANVATSALDWMIKERDTTVIADIDPERALKVLVYRAPELAPPTPG